MWFSVAVRIVQACARVQPGPESPETSIVAELLKVDVRKSFSLSSTATPSDTSIVADKSSSHLV